MALLFREEKSVQSFPLEDQVYARFIKVRLASFLFVISLMSCWRSSFSLTLAVSTIVQSVSSASWEQAWWRNTRIRKRKKAMAFQEQAKRKVRLRTNVLRRDVEDFPRRQRLGD